MENNNKVQPTSQSSGIKRLDENELNTIKTLVEMAKNFPRDEMACVSDIEKACMTNRETAESCFYLMKRKDKSGKMSFIRGNSIRFAEIVISKYGNLWMKSIPIANDGIFITNESIIFDLQKISVVTLHTTSKITYSDGQTYSFDMQGISQNRLVSIGLRNAVFKIVPPHIINPIVDKVKRYIIGDEKKMEETKKKAIDFFQKNGVTDGQLCKFLEIHEISKMTPDNIFDLRCLVQAIVDKETSIQEAFSIKHTDKGLGKFSQSANNEKLKPKANTDTKVDSESKNENDNNGVSGFKPQD